jgi:hypothetical protein
MTKINLDRHVDVVLVEKSEQCEIIDWTELVNSLGEVQRVYLLKDVDTGRFRIALDTQMCLAAQKHDDTAVCDYHVSVWRVDEANPENFVVTNQLNLLKLLGDVIAKIGTNGIKSNFTSVSIIKRDKVAL